MSLPRVLRHSPCLLGLLFVFKAAPAFSSDTVETWLGGTGSWETSADWTNDAVPEGKTYAAVIDGNSAMRSLVSIGTNQSNWDDVVLDSCQLDDGDTLVVNADSSLTVGSFALNGAVTVNSGATVGVQSLAAGSTAGLLVNGGAFLASSGGLTAGAAGQPFTIENGGTVGLGYFDTAGYSVNVGAGTLSVGTLTNSTGTVVLGGSSTLSVSGSYTLAGTHDFSVQSGGSLQFGTLNTAGNSYSVASGTKFSAGTLNNTGSFAINGSATINQVSNSGQMALGSGAVVSAAGTWDSTGGSVALTGNAILGFSTGGITGGHVSVGADAQLFIAPGAQQAGTYGNFTLDSGAMWIGSAASPYDSSIVAGTITNNGTISLAGYADVGDNSVTFAGSGTFNFSGTIYGHQSSFTNQGVLKGYGQLFTSNTLGVSDSAVNDGTIEATPQYTNPGLLGFGGTVSSNAADGKMIVDSNAELSLSGNTFTSAGSITVAGGGTLAFGNNSSGTTTDSASSIVNNGTLTLTSANVQVGNLSGSGAVQVKFFDTLSAGQISCSSLAIAAPSTVTLEAPAAGSGVVVDSVGALTIPSGKLALMPASTGSDRIVLEADSISGLGSNHIITGLIDLANNDLIVHNGNLSQIRTAILTASQSGKWTGGQGITSSTAAADGKTLGFMLNDDGSGNAIYSTFDGQSVVSTDVLVKYTLYGDATLDGSVNVSDLAVLATHFGMSSGATWAQGDFNNDGAVNVSDLAELATNFGQSLGGGGLTADESAAMFDAALAQVEATDPRFAAQVGAVVPEPGAIGLLAFAVLGSGRRRRSF